ncbi:MAG: hypothetical protein ACOCXN_05095, partial [Spirochaetota bacterium]
QRFVCKHCGKGMGMQTESMHYYAKRRLDLADILSRVHGGSSLRDIGRELGCSRMAIANAVVRLGDERRRGARMVPGGRDAEDRADAEHLPAHDR